MNPERIKAAYNRNSDGFGIMWVENNQVNIVKGLLTLDQVQGLIKKLEGKPYACHFRFRTHGALSDAQCHPYLILDKQTHGADLYMMHNGTICSLPNDPVKSDSQIFALILKKQILERHPNNPRIVTDQRIIDRIGRAIGYGNKILFMSDDGIVKIANEACGEWIKGIWYSNTYSIALPKPIKVKIKHEKNHFSSDKHANPFSMYNPRDWVIRRGMPGYIQQSEFAKKASKEEKNEKNSTSEPRVYQNAAMAISVNNGLV